MNTEIKRLRRQKKHYILLWYLTVLCMFGIFLNYTVISNNECKMPFVANYHYETDTHVSFQDKSEVKYSYLSDVIEIKLFNLIVSIGDIIMVVGGFLVVFIVGREVYYVFRYDLKELKDGDVE